MQSLTAGPANSLHHPPQAGRQISEERRPGITKLFLRIKAQHPRWPDWRAAAAAKQQWTNAEKGGAA